MSAQTDALVTLGLAYSDLERRHEEALARLLAEEEVADALAHRLRALNHRLTKLEWERAYEGLRRPQRWWSSWPCD